MLLLMVLSKTKILEMMKKGELKVTPFVRENLGAASIDLQLGNEFLVPKGKCRIAVREDTYFSGGFRKCVKKVSAGKEGITLKPFRLVLGTTLERVALSKNLCGTLQGRSRFARLGVMVHISSNFVQPGVDNVQVLEILNVSPFTLTLYPGMKICQIRFDRVEAGVEYQGSFKRQKGI
ncbi:MAG: dCTP deaminase [Candidatus Micrarchaeia archaeon]